MTSEIESQRSHIAQMEKEMNHLSTELIAQKEANIRSPSTTMKNLIERLKAELNQKEKKLKVFPHIDIFNWNLFNKSAVII